MKKALIFAYLLICISFSSVSANDGKEVYFISNDEISSAPITYVIDGYTNMDKKILRMPSSYDQNDYTSGSAGKCNGTIADYGCSITAFADVRDYYYPKNKKNPSVINNELKKAGLAGYCIDFAAAAEYYGLYQVVHKRSLSYSTKNYYDFYKIVKKYVDAGEPVIFCVSDTSGTHFMVAYGYAHMHNTDSYAIYVLNTGSSEITNMDEVNRQWPKRTISEYIVISD